MGTSRQYHGECTPGKGRVISNGTAVQHKRKRATASNLWSHATPPATSNSRISCTPRIEWVSPLCCQHLPHVSLATAHHGKHNTTSPNAANKCNEQANRKPKQWLVLFVVIRRRLLLLLHSQHCVLQQVKTACAPRRGAPADAGAPRPLGTSSASATLPR